MDSDNMYQKGIDTRERIIESAKGLFYQHGYNKTTIKMITEDAKVSLSAIPYYFTKKEQIIRVIYNSFLERIYEYLSSVLPQKPDSYLLHHYASKIFYDIILNDSNNSRFYYEVSISQSNYTLLDPFTNQIHQNYARDFNISLTEKQQRLIRMADAGARREVFYNYYNHLDDLTIDDLINYVTSIAGTLIGIHISVAEKYAKNATEFVKGLDYSHIKFLI